MQDRPGTTGEGNPDSGPTFESSLAELEAIVHDLEEGQLGLAEALGRYEQGVKHLKHCHALLQQAERKIELLTGVAEDGTPITQPMDDAAEALPEAAGRRCTRKPPRVGPPPLDIAEPTGGGTAGENDIDD